MRIEFRIILVKPRNPDNIGAAARAMANFGLRELALVSAFESDWGEAEKNWRKEASVSAIDSMEIINSARLFGSIPEAAEGCDMLLGTSSLHRVKPERDVILLSQAAVYAESRGASRVGLLFGSEKTGLTKEDLSFCSAIINIPTRENQPSMNLGQSVAVAAYELAARCAGKPAALRQAAPEPSPMEIEGVVEKIREKLTREAGKHWAAEAQVRAIRRGLLDARLTKNAMNALNLLLKKT